MHEPRSLIAPVLHRATVACVLLMGVLSACDDFVPPHSDPPAVTTLDAGKLPPAAAADASLPPTAAPGDAGAHDGSLAPQPTAQAGRSQVLLANPREHSVAVIDPTTLAVQQVACSNAPSLVAAREDSDLGLAVDVDAQIACVLDSTGQATTAVELAVLPHANTIALSPGARFALVYHDRRKADGQHQPARDTQEVSVVQLQAPALGARVLVGLRPRDVVFSEDGKTAFVTSDAGVSVIGLAAAARGELPTAGPHGTTSGPWLRDATLRVASEGARAIAFAVDGSMLHVIDFARGVTLVLDLEALVQPGAGVQDAGEAADGPAHPRIADAVVNRLGTRAWLALRGEQAVVEVSIAAAPLHSVAAFPLPGQPTDRLALSFDEQRLLVLAQAPDDGRATLLPVASPAGSLRLSLPASPDLVLSATTVDALVLLHGVHDALPGGYTLVRLRDGLTRFSQASAPPVGLQLSADAQASCAVFASEDGPGTTLELIDLPTLELTQHRLEGVPLTTGFAGEARYVFVQLEHPDGRLSFIERDGGKSRTLTGFLIAQPEQDPRP